MKVLMITRTMAEFANQQYKIREIARAGITLTVVSPPCWAGQDNELQRVKPDGFELLMCNCRFSRTRSVRLGNHLHFYPHISDVIGRENWDLIHIDEEPFNLGTFHALRACREHGKPAIFTTWQNVMKHYPPPFNFFERYVFKRARGAVAGNTEGLDVLRRRGFHKPAEHIPQLGVDPSNFRKQSGGGIRKGLSTSNHFTVGFIGRFSPEKGLDTLIRALSLLPNSCVAMLMGAGPEHSRLLGLARSLGLSDRIRWLPWVPSERVPEYLNALDAVVLPSRTLRNVKEQFGRILVEAMACEVCVVGSDSGEIPKVIGDAGLTFPEGDERELAERLRRLMDSPLLRESLGRRGRRRVMDNFSYAKIASDTVSFYRRLCSINLPTCDSAQAEMPNLISYGGSRN